MDIKHFIKVRGPRQLMVFLGLSFLVCAVGLLFGHIAGFLPKGSLSFLGQGDLRSIAGLAVAGCLLAAIGYGEI